MQRVLSNFTACLRHKAKRQLFLPLLLCRPSVSSLIFKPLRPYAQDHSVVMPGAVRRLQVLVVPVSQRSLQCWPPVPSSVSCSLPPISPSWIFSRALPIGCSRWVWPLTFRFVL